ncbi:hypothetical protein GmHk_14G040745 [Glycine max]|nr:hypothetical protein GmHk_14G040745 [Glycine max]
MLDKQKVVGLSKPADRPDHDVDDPLYLMTLTIPHLFLKPLHMNETSMRAGNADVYGFLKPQFIQRSGQSQFESKSYIKNWMQNSRRDVYLGTYLNGAHWQMVVILPKENVVIWFCSLHNRPDNYLKGIINKLVLFFNTFALALVGNINILIAQCASMFVFNSALKRFDDTPQSKSKAAARWIVVKCNRQKGNTECEYYVMHGMSTIILGTFKNN